MEVTRRRMITLMGGVSALACTPQQLLALQKEQKLFQVKRYVLGAEGGFQLYHPEKGRAAQLIQHALDEIERLETIFSLYRPQSALSRLNRAGVLHTPPEELVDVLQTAQRISAETDGAFDVSIQPLWQLYADHFAQAHANPAGPSRHALQRALKAVDYRAMTITPDRIVLEKPNMQLTLNGIAQGYITDRIVQLLKAGGINHTLVELGETAALGHHPDGAAWRIGIADPQQPDRIARALPLTNQAIASSGGYGSPFERTGTHHHLLDPRTGRSAAQHAGVSVIAPTAMEADALATAFAIMPAHQIEAYLAQKQHIRALFAHRLAS